MFEFGRTNFNLHGENMKLVFDLNEVAAALGQTSENFRTLRPKLESLGFPKQLRGLDERWSIIDVINWVNNEGASGGGGFAETAPDNHGGGANNGPDSGPNNGHGKVVKLKSPKNYMQ